MYTWNFIEKSFRSCLQNNIFTVIIFLMKSKMNFLSLYFINFFCDNLLTNISLNGFNFLAKKLRKKYGRSKYACANSFFS